MSEIISVVGAILVQTFTVGWFLSAQNKRIEHAEKALERLFDRLDRLVERQ